jgi:L-aspartate oxidase
VKEGIYLSKRRYLVDFDFACIEKEYHDVVIIGSGIAGVFTALEINKEADVAILTKETLDISNTVLAQGGIAVSLDKNDSPELHFKDTIYAGAGLCEEESVWVVVREAASNIDRLCKFGVNFDKIDRDKLSLSREGAHSMNRIIHAGDTTGKEICDKLISVVHTRNNIKIFEKTFVIDIITEKGKCKGVLACYETTGKLKLILSDLVVCATGGYGQLYSRTTNPVVATGDGISMAYRAGAELMDLEFVQFHPTVLYHPKNKSFLISEAVRGEGALLKNDRGERFMLNYHPMGELAPRDVVSRVIFNEMKKTGTENVYLDITFKGKDYLKQRFPNIYKTCMSYGIDMAKDYIPVAPAEHYCMGGIRADVKGRTNIEGLYACGECACNGLHGANRLASNSLLEGLVFGRVIAESINDILQKGKINWWPERSINALPERGQEDKPGTGTGCDAGRGGTARGADTLEGYTADEGRHWIKDAVRREMTENVGIIRTGEGMKKALDKVNGFIRDVEDIKNTSLSDIELQNMLILARLVIESAIERKESRGAHYRLDFSEMDDKNWRRHIIKKR